MARCLLTHMSVPHFFWPDALLTACYLINRLPSSSLNNQIPFTVLYPNKPLFHAPRKVFGSLCFVHNLEPRATKLLQHRLGVSS